MATTTFCQSGRVTITAEGEPPFSRGDTIKFSITVDIPEPTTGIKFYLSIDDQVFRPVLTDGLPFITGNFMPSAATNENGTHRDSLHLDPMDNGIPGWQMDFYHFLIPSTENPVSGQGIGAYFYLEVVDIPLDTPTLKFDRSNLDSRESGYYRYFPETGVSSYYKYSNHPAEIEVELAGIVIRPALPDTLILPGTDLNIYLGQHFYSGVPGVDSTDAVWSTIIYNKPAGSSLTLIPEAGPTTRLNFTTDPLDHDILDVLIKVDATDGIDFYADEQNWRVYVDYPPAFSVALPSFTFDEDTQLPYVANANGGGTIFRDDDDTGTAITMWLEPDSLVHLSYDNVNTVTFFADTNWFGSVSSRLFVRDALGISADTLLSFTVNGVNDLPVINLDGISGDSALVDTVIIHRSTPDTVDLRPFASDEEDPTPAFSWINPDPTNLTITDLGGGLWELLAYSLSPFIDIDVTVTVTDDSSAQASDILVVSIRSWPPVLDSLGNLIVLSDPPTPLVIDLNSLVSDNDTPDAVMSWTFAAVDYFTGVTDDSVSLTWDSLAQTLTITPDSGYAAIDILRYTVEDDDNNITSDSTRLGIFSSLKPVLLPFPRDTVISNSQTVIIDLDDYILDPVDAPADIIWTSSGGARLQQVSIDPLSHLVTVTTNAFFFGNDTITFTARNSADSTASGDLLLRVVPENNGPPVWQDLPDVEVVYPDIVDVFTLTSVVADDFTPGDQLIFKSFVRSDADSIILLIDGTTWAVQLAAPRQDIYESWFYFTAEDDLGESAQSDTVKVIVTDFYSPVWDNIPTIRFRTDQTYRDTLSKYLSDPDITNNPITVTVTKRVPSITVSYDNATTELVITSSAVASDSYLSITATNSHGKSTTYAAHVIVVLHIDLIPPDGEITYFFNPVADHWLDFVVVADSTVDQFRSNYSWKSLPAPLLFLQQDSLPGVQSWRTSQEFVEEGEYQLVVTLVDASNNVRELRLGPTTVSLSKAVGNSFLSPDNLLDVSYPALPVRDGQLIVLSEIPWPEQDAADPPATDHALLRGDLPKKIYSLDTNLPDPIMVTVVYHDPALRDDYHAFYEYFEQTLERVETYALGSGRFQAEVLLGKDIVFGGSGIRAGAAPLPYDHLLLYPNPFNSALTISFMLRAEEIGLVRIYNLLGQEVFSTGKRTLAAGVNRFHWTGIAAGGRTVPSGIYFIRLETDRGLLVTKKVTMLK
ncbi:MAG: T9SS type A sorting domain-containing protein [Candidatus Marinimicrobia bacterium]|nr:T9SS type A sorting domain-containing protein [Candidatus Neomarinimicrobiota bacterium]